MALREILKKIDALQNEINLFGKLDNDLLKKIQYKFRLDWNYNSNAMEGNSLTKEETRSVMINNITVEGKPLKDVIEIRGHDAVVSDILKIGKGELRLSEARMKSIHSAIMHEENPEHRNKIGQWKTINNHVINYKDEKFEFVPYAEVHEHMHDLINWLNSQNEKIKSNEKSALHPVLLALDFHLRYVTIHPFYDGNGRTARIFTNLILVSFGYPPIIIKVEDKETYNRYLADVQAYGGAPDLFYEFMSKQLIYSQELVLKALKGESIEEPDDLDKEISLLKKNLTVLPGEVEKSQEVLNQLWNNSLLYLKDSFEKLHNKFTELFEKTQFLTYYTVTGELMHYKSDQEVLAILNDTDKCKHFSSVELISQLLNMKRYSSHNSETRIKINFSTVSYTITCSRGATIKKHYSEQLTKQEIDALIQEAGKSMIEELNEVADQKNK